MKLKIVMIAVTIIVLIVSGKSWSQNSVSQTVTEKKKNKNMETSTIEKNKAVVRKLFEEILSKKRTELLKDVIADEFPGARGSKGHEGFLEPIKPIFAAFPDIEWKILDIMGEDNKVMLRWKWQGTHKAEFNHFPATGKTITNDGMAVYELKNGKVISTNFLTDRLGFWQQIGVIPEDLSQLPGRKN
jgi:steroid delta-isomerase-like uncharacterized protein